MKTVIWKFYVNYEKEEAWLNKMSAQGLALVAYSWCRYVFEDALPGEYTYRIELLENLPSHPESQKYIEFMEESGVEHVASYMRWVYFRKKATAAPFDIYSDSHSKIKHLRRINLFASVLALAEFAVGATNIVRYFLPGYGGSFHLWIGLILVAFGFEFIWMGHPARRQMRRLNKVKSIRE